MWSNHQTRIDHRIVSLTQPHVRPIVRGKSGNPTEFGAKLSVSCVEGYVLLEKMALHIYGRIGLNRDPVLQLGRGIVLCFR
jgi:transposase, IS5 family